MFVTVSEKWDYVHTNDIRVSIHFKLDEMLDQGKFLNNPITGDRSVYATDGSPTKIFTNIEYAQEYINFISKLNPVSTILHTFNNSESLNAFLLSVHDPDYCRHSGPTVEEHIQLANKTF